MAIISYHIPRWVVEEDHPRVLLKLAAMPVTGTYSVSEVTDHVNRLNSLSKWYTWQS